MKVLTGKLQLRGYILGAVCLFVLCGILVAGLWPFNPFPKNDVTWLTNQNGLHFGPEGIAFSSGRFQRASSSSSACSLEMLVRPDRNEASNDILTFYSREAPQRLRLLQWAGSTLLLYHDVGGQHREIDVGRALHPGVPVLITIAGGAGGTSVYMNGTLAGRSARFPLSTNDISGQLILGTSPLADSSWAGEIDGIAVYANELTAAQAMRHFTAWNRDGRPAIAVDDAPVALYAFSERQGRVVHNETGAAPDLYIPEYFVIPHKSLLIAPWKDIRWNKSWLKDATLNIAGFIPLGFSLCAYLSLKSKRPALLTILAGASVSLTIEVVQVYLPTRTSSSADVIANVLGVAFGVLLFESVAASKPVETAG